MLLSLIKKQITSLLLMRLRWPWAYQAVVSIEHLLFGSKVRMEACSKCQLACPSCSTAQGTNRTGIVGWGALKAEAFRKFVEQSKRIRKIELSSWGEIFLNPELVEIMKCAAEKGIALEAENGVNLNSVSDQMLEALVQYRFRLLSVSIDGATDDTYRIYRKNGSLSRVLGNIDRINYYKLKYKSERPRLVWQFIVFGHNEHEIPEARRMAEERGMRFNPIMNLDPDRFPVRDPALVQLQTGMQVETNQTKALANIGRDFDFCKQLWDNPQINWDGKLLGCCFNNVSDFGNVFEQGLSKALSGESYAYAKKMVLGLEPPREDIPCTSCPVYRAMGWQV